MRRSCISNARRSCAEELDGLSERENTEPDEPAYCGNSDHSRQHNETTCQQPPSESLRATWMIGSRPFRNITAIRFISNGVSAKHAQTCRRPFLGLLRQSRHDSRRQDGGFPSQRFWMLVLYLVLYRATHERRLALQALIRHCRKGIYILYRGRRIAVQLLRRHVLKRPA